MSKRSNKIKTMENYNYLSFSAIITAFHRAFKNVHGISPSQAKEEGIMVKAYPPIYFQIDIKGVSEMNFRIETKAPFRVIGISRPLEMEIEKNFETVPVMWGNALSSGTIGKLASFMEGSLQGLLGISSCNEANNWRYYIGVNSNQPLLEDFEELMIPKAMWAIFAGEGSNQSIQELEKRIITEWLPTSGYEYGNAPDIEVYFNANPGHAKYEVWIPVVKKED